MLKFLWAQVHMGHFKANPGLIDVILFFNAIVVFSFENTCIGQICHSENIICFMEVSLSLLPLI